MVNVSVERVSALAEDYTVGRFGAGGEIGVTLCEVPDLILFQAAVWPDTLTATGNKAAESIGATAFPGPGQAVTGARGALLRIEPLKFWIVGAGAPALSADEGATLDLSHSRAHVRISGPSAAVLLNRYVPLDLRDSTFPIGSVASTIFDHVGVTLWRSDTGYELFLPRGFALSLWHVLLEGAAQFGAEIST